MVFFFFFPPIQPHQRSFLFHSAVCFVGMTSGAEAWRIPEPAPARFSVPQYCGEPPMHPGGAAATESRCFLALMLFDPGVVFRRSGAPVSSINGRRSAVFVTHLYNRPGAVWWPRRSRARCAMRLQKTSSTAISRIMPHSSSFARPGKKPARNAVHGRAFFRKEDRLCSRGPPRWRKWAFLQNRPKTTHVTG